MWSEHQEAWQQAQLADTPDGAVSAAAKLANAAALSTLVDAGCSLDATDKVSQTPTPPPCTPARPRLAVTRTITVTVTGTGTGREEAMEGEGEGKREKA